jgi:hypothetical protein
VVYIGLAVGTVGVLQTFLPYPDFAASAVVLDRRRLGKQRVEALQILRALTRERYGWKHHPAVRMWAGYEEALACYAMEICAEWVRRGHADSCAASIGADLRAAGPRGCGPLGPNRNSQPSSGCRPGSVTSGCTAATARRWSEKIPFTTGTASTTSRRTWRISGRCAAE